MVRNPDASERSKSIQKYSNILMKAIGRKGNSDRLNSVLDKFNKEEYKNDWEIWKKERTKRNGDKHMKSSKSKDPEDNKVSDKEEDSDDNELLPMKIVNSVTEWQILENVFYKKDNKISLEVPPQLHKVETILNEYDESLEKATEDNFVDLDSVLFEKGITDEEKLKQKLETYGIFIDRRDFIFYAMIYYNGAYLVDEIISFTIPDTPTQLCLLKDIVTDLLSFRARVEHIYTQITNLLKSATSQHRSR
ncbi:1897_t:CDS:2 [Funneliformis geosporum]|uniref:7165_t:CDS:1 n=1 Tax=Funneliformis geosporum TaxID=1117311 RepID=A0A9W4X5C4_9GLOM|nr:7165_t:CDS:2 [Funneliformis geosporum]CAI2187949.1 1897_t:CDS:2 [Funneliformis geosporum]